MINLHSFLSASFAIFQITYSVFAIVSDLVRTCNRTEYYIDNGCMNDKYGGIRLKERPILSSKVVLDEGY